MSTTEYFNLIVTWPGLTIAYYSTCFSPYRWNSIVRVVTQDAKVHVPGHVRKTIVA